jgi:hypothetical protein
VTGIPPDRDRRQGRIKPDNRGFGRRAGRWLRSARACRWVRSARRALGSLGARSWVRPARRALGSLGARTVFNRSVKEHRKLFFQNHHRIRDGFRPGKSPRNLRTVRESESVRSELARCRFHEDPADESRFEAPFGGGPYYREFITMSGTADAGRHAGIGLVCDDVIADQQRVYRSCHENNEKDRDRSTFLRQFPVPGRRPAEWKDGLGGAAGGRRSTSLSPFWK